MITSIKDIQKGDKFISLNNVMLIVSDVDILRNKITYFYWSKSRDTGHPIRNFDDKSFESFSMQNKVYELTTRSAFKKKWYKDFKEFYSNDLHN